MSKIEFYIHSKCTILCLVNEFIVVNFWKSYGTLDAAKSAINEFLQQETVNGNIIRTALGTVKDPKRILYIVGEREKKKNTWKEYIEQLCKSVNDTVSFRDAIASADFKSNLFVKQRDDTNWAAFIKQTMPQELKWD